jgi:hypothetical protein
MLRNDVIEFCIKIMYSLTSDFFVCSLNSSGLLCLKVEMAMKELFSSVKSEVQGKFRGKGNMYFSKLFCHFTNKWMPNWIACC